MRSRRARRLSAGEMPWPRWPMLATAAVLGGLFAIYAGLFSYAIITETVRPQLALRLYGGLPRAAARAGDLVLAISARQRGNLQQSASAFVGPGADLPIETRRAVQHFAREGLTATPLTSAGLRQLALAEPRPAQQQRLLELSNQVSRRDVLAALQLSEIRARAGDIRDALENFNRALIISDQVDSIVFPNLLRSASNAEFREQMANLLKKNPDWAVRLVRWSIDNPQTLPNLSLLVGGIAPGSEALAIGYGQQMVDQLNNQGKFREAFAIYDAYSRKRQDPADLSRFTFPPIDWRLIDNIDTGSRPYRPGTIEVFSEPGRTGDVMLMLTRLAPGTYAWRMRVRETNGQDAMLRLTAACIQGQGNSALGDLQQPLRNGTLMLQFSVTPTCPYQRLVVGISGGKEAGGALIDSMALNTRQRESASAAP